VSALPVRLVMQTARIALLQIVLLPGLAHRALAEARKIAKAVVAEVCPHLPEILRVLRHIEGDLGVVRAFLKVLLLTVLP
jgi:hypothetical protein